MNLLQRGVNGYRKLLCVDLYQVSASRGRCACVTALRVWRQNCAHQWNRSNLLGESNACWIARAIDQEHIAFDDIYEMTAQVSK